MARKFSGAICGGSRKYAIQQLKEKGHCFIHKKLDKKCEACLDKYIELTDIYFMALM